MLSNRRISNFQSVERSIVVKSVFQISDSAQNSQLYECKYFANSKFPDLRISEFPTYDTLKPQNFRIHLPIAKFPTAFNPPKYKSKHKYSKTFVPVSAMNVTQATFSNVHLSADDRER